MMSPAERERMRADLIAGVRVSFQLSAVEVAGQIERAIDNMCANGLAEVVFEVDRWYVQFKNPR